MRSSSNEQEQANNSGVPGASRAGAHALPIGADDRDVSAEREHLRERLDILEQKLDRVLATLISAPPNNQFPIGAQHQWPREMFAPNPPIQNNHSHLNHYLVSRI